VNRSGDIDRQVGLCSVCQMVQRVVSARGSTFYLCRRAEADERYSRYPPLPVTECTGFVGNGEAGRDQEGE
jgi:hypothetical protein